MTTITTPTTTRTAAIRGVPFARLVAVEWRKLYDTRIAKVLAALLMLGGITVMTGYAVARGPQLQATISISGLVLSTLLPVLGILSVTGEWSHRTALTTFALEPRRWRVVVAKLVPPVVSVVIACAIAVAAAAAIVPAVAQGQGVAADWSLDPAQLAGWAAVNLIEVTIGMAFGMALLNAPAAIVLLFTSPMIWTLVTLIGPEGETAAEWFDRNRTTSPLIEGDLTGPDALRLVVSLIVSIVAPLVIGFVRVARREIR